MYHQLSQRECFLYLVNKEIEVENLKQENIIAQRIVCDAISSAGGISKVPLVKEMLMSCSLARQKHMAFLENQRELKKTEQQKRKRETLLEEVDDLKAKKERLQNAMQKKQKVYVNLK